MSQLLASKKFLRQIAPVAGLALLGAASVAQASGTTTAFGPLYPTLSNPCAIFNSAVPATTFTKIVYGEPINFTITGQVVTESPDGSGKIKVVVKADGYGVGGTSGIKYKFVAKLQLQGAPVNGAFSGKFKGVAKIIGESQDRDDRAGKLAQSTQDNALFQFEIQVNYANGNAVADWSNVASNFSMSCQGSPWTNLTATAPERGGRDPRRDKDEGRAFGSDEESRKAFVGRGFGDVWNKYAWSAQDFGGGLLFGTKNAYFNYASIASYSDESITSPAALCYRNPANITPIIYKGLAGAELFEAPAEGGTATDTHFAEIWRFDKSGKTWSKVRDDTESQGFRIMTTHSSKLYVGSDLGSFVAGVSLQSGGAGNWTFPGSRILSSVDGKNFTAVPCDSSVNGPCTSATAQAITNPSVNVSFRAMTSYGGKLYLGTFNPTGGELWSYDATAVPASAWTLIKKFSPANGAPFPANQYHPAVTELTVFNGKLYVGLGGTGYDYLRTYDGNTLSAVPNLPVLNSPTNIGVLKLFASSKGLLYIGCVDFAGFNLQTMNTGGTFATVTTDGFANSANAYAWSMVEYGDRTYVGTFNTGFLNNAPRGSAELWYSDDTANWRQVPLPLGFGFWNYGIRTMVVADKRLYLGTASNIVAPDLLIPLLPLSPGAEVWSVDVDKVAPKLTNR